MKRCELASATQAARDARLKALRHLERLARFCGCENCVWVIAAARQSAAAIESLPHIVERSAGYPLPPMP